MERDYCLSISLYSTQVFSIFYNHRKIEDLKASVEVVTGCIPPAASSTSSSSSVSDEPGLQLCVCVSPHWACRISQPTYGWGGISEQIPA